MAFFSTFCIVLSFSGNSIFWFEEVVNTYCSFVGKLKEIDVLEVRLS